METVAFHVEVVSRASTELVPARPEPPNATGFASTSKQTVRIAGSAVVPASKLRSARAELAPYRVPQDRPRAVLLVSIPKPTPIIAEPATTYVRAEPFVLPESVVVQQARQAAAMCVWIPRVTSLTVVDAVPDAPPGSSASMDRAWLSVTPVKPTVRVFVPVCKLIAITVVLAGMPVPTTDGVCVVSVSPSR